MALAILGDLHGSPRGLATACTRAVAQGAVALLQVGDFGIYPALLELYAKVEPLPLPVYVIDGNHEHHPIVPRRMDCPVPLTTSITYVPRGLVLVLDGKRVGFLGGAASIDYKWRTPGRDWFREEQVAQEDVDRLVANGPVDLLVTHCPPDWMIQQHFEAKDPMAKVRMFGVSPEWHDPSGDLVEQAWGKLGKPPLYCGHMHASITDGVCRILDIAELVVV